MGMSSVNNNRRRLCVIENCRACYLACDLGPVVSFGSREVAGLEFVSGGTGRWCTTYQSSLVVLRQS